MIYLDHNASTPLLPEVKDELIRSWDLFGNPSGDNVASLLVADEISQSREKISRILNVNAQDVLFTSGSTEAIAIGIYGVILGAPSHRDTIFVSGIEHKAVLATCHASAGISGKRVIEIPVNRSGLIDINFLEENVDEKTALICFMSANNETGVIQDLEGLLSVAARFDTPVFCDSTQSFGKDPAFQNRDLSSFLSIVSGHKIYGPKGSGLAIFPRRFQRTMFQLLAGGGQERNLRGGTLNVSAALGLTKALEISLSKIEEFNQGVRLMKDAFISRLTESLDGKFVSNVDPSSTLNNTLSLRFDRVSAQDLIANFKEVIASRASACTAGREEPSHVLLAMGLSVKEAESTIRFSFGYGCKLSEMPRAAQDVSEAVDRVQLLNK